MYDTFTQASLNRWLECQAKKPANYVPEFSIVNLRVQRMNSRDVVNQLMQTPLKKFTLDVNPVLLAFDGASIFQSLLTVLSYAPVEHLHIPDVSKIPVEAWQTFHGYFKIMQNPITSIEIGDKFQNKTCFKHFYKAIENSKLQALYIDCSEPNWLSSRRFTLANLKINFLHLNNFCPPAINKEQIIDFAKRLPSTLLHVGFATEAQNELMPLVLKEMEKMNLISLYVHVNGQRDVAWIVKHCKTLPIAALHFDCHSLSLEQANQVIPMIPKTGLDYIAITLNEGFGAARVIADAAVDHEKRLKQYQIEFNELPLPPPVTNIVASYLNLWTEKHGFIARDNPKLLEIQKRNNVIFD